MNTTSCFEMYEREITKHEIIKIQKAFNDINGFKLSSGSKNTISCKNNRIELPNVNFEDHSFYFFKLRNFKSKTKATTNSQTLNF